jgi:hypothetical protein
MCTKVEDSRLKALWGFNVLLCTYITSRAYLSADGSFMSQQIHPEHIEVSQAGAAMLTQYPEDELQTIDPKARECAETPSRAGKASTKQRPPSGSTERSGSERSPPYSQQHRKRSAADLNNDPGRPMKRRSSRVHRKIKRDGFFDWRNIDLAQLHTDSIPSTGLPKNSPHRLVRRGLSPLASCESLGMQPDAPYRSSYGSVSKTQEFRAGQVGAYHAS